MLRQRVDTLLVERGLATSRAQAQAIIMAGEVLAQDQVVRKPSLLLARDTPIQVLERPPFVSRGGIKLAHALDQLRLDPADWVVADVGASTGGFTDCLLQRGAQRVYAIDVGYGQLDYRLRNDPRVRVMERVNARYLFFLPEAVDLVTVDVSFISVRKVVPSVAHWVKEGRWVLVLLKPQFEAGKGQVGKGGVVRNPQVHAAVLARFLCWAVREGFRLRGLLASSLLGASGNREFFVLHQSTSSSGAEQGRLA